MAIKKDVDSKKKATISKVVDDYLPYLNKHKLPKGNPDGVDITLTTMGEPALRGSFLITDEEYNDFIQKYKTTKNARNIVERQKTVGPLLVDVDLRFDNKHKDREYTKEDVEYFIKKFTEKIQKYYKVKNEHLYAYVCEKEIPSYDEKNKEYKDGFHISYSNLPIHYYMRYLIREEVLAEIEAEDKLSHLPFINSLDDVIDKSVIMSNGWMMYGSNKHEAQAYVLTGIYDKKQKNIYTKGKPFDELVDVLSVRRFKEEECLEIRDTINILEMEKKLEEIANRYDKKKKKDNKDNKNKKNVDIANADLDLDNADAEQEELDDEFPIEVINNNNNDKQKEKLLEKVRKIINILSKKRAEIYSDWIRVGWALYNIDNSLLKDYIKFSKKCPAKYKAGCCEEVWRGARDGGLGLSALLWWGRQDDPTGYTQILTADINEIMKEAESGTHYDIAKVVYALYGHFYVCTSIKNKQWYEYQGHRWVPIDGAYTLSMKISEDLTKEFASLISLYYAEAGSKKGFECDTQMKKAEDLRKIILNLKKNGFKECVLAECMRIFYNDKIEERFDSNKDLLGFDNGVYDLKLGCFRAGVPDDFITLSVDYDYKEYKSTDSEVMEVMKYFDSVHTEKDMREYILTLLASYLDGHVKQQKFIIWTGSGCHAKDTKIMMCDKTYKLVQDIDIGDKIMGDNMRARTVMDLYRGIEKMYKVSHFTNNALTAKYVVNQSHRLALSSVSDYEISFDDTYNGWKLDWLEYLESENIPISRGKYFIINANRSKQEAYDQAKAYVSELKTGNKIIHKDQIIPISVFDFINLDKSLKQNFRGIRYSDKELIREEIVVEYTTKDKFYGFQLDGNQRYIFENNIITYNSNGKSMTIELAQHAFGKYFDTLPSTVLTRKRGGASNATPELANKRGKRFVVFQEPEDDDKIYVGFMKELTGGDWIMARGLFKDPFRFKPQFKLLLTCNKLPFIPSNDGGTWRRLRVSPWESKFVDGVPNAAKREFKKDYNLTDKLEGWKQPLIWLLLKIYYPKYIKEGLIEPKKVTLFTDNYKKDSDVYFEYFSEHLEKTEVDKDNELVNTVFESFREWLKENHSSSRIPNKKEFVEYLNTKDYIMKNERIYRIKFKVKAGDDVGQHSDFDITV